MKKRITGLMVFFMIVGSIANLSSQSLFDKTDPQYTVQIASNVNGASVTIDGKFVGTTPLSTKLTKANHLFILSAPGYQTLQQTQLVTKSQILSFTLVQEAATLTITTNVSSAKIFLNNSMVGTGSYSAQTNPGSYNLQISAPGYSNYSQIINMGTKNMVVPIQLNIEMFKLKVIVNPGNASIYLDGQYIGTGSATTSTSPGTHTIKAVAPGYNEAVFVVDVDKQNYTLPISLQSAASTITFNLPTWIINSRIKNPEKYFVIYIDGQNMKKVGMGESTTIDPGNHTIEITTGALSFSATYNFQVGKNYNVTIGNMNNPLSITF